MKREVLSAAIRAVRQHYDALSKGDRAILRRCHTASAVKLMSQFHAVAGALASVEPHLAHVVLLFASAEQQANAGPSGVTIHRHVTEDKAVEVPVLNAKPTSSLRFGQYATRYLARDGSKVSDGAKAKFRRVLVVSDRDDLDAKVRAVFDTSRNMPIDWGTFGVDLLWFFAGSGSVRTQWAQDFFAPVGS